MRPAFLLEATLWTAAGWYLYFASLWQVADGLAIAASRTALTAGASLARSARSCRSRSPGLGAREVIYIQVLRARARRRPSARSRSRSCTWP